MKEAEVLIQFDLNSMSSEQQEHLHEAQKHLLEAGVSFDTGTGFGCRDWEWDWSLKGPVKVLHKKFKGENDEQSSN